MQEEAEAEEEDVAEAEAEAEAEGVYSQFLIWKWVLKNFFQWVNYF